MDIKNKISCSCGQCGIELNGTSPKYSVMCACEDRRQALSLAERMEAKNQKIFFIQFIRSDIKL